MTMFWEPCLEAFISLKLITDLDECEICMNVQNESTNFKNQSKK